MNNFFKTATLGTLALFATTSAKALTPEAAINQSMTVIVEAALPQLTDFNLETPTLDIKATIGIARLDGGRLISAPFHELRHWAFLNKRSAAKFDIVSPAALIKNMAAVSVINGRESVNQLDEIRMTASDLRMDYVLIYGMDKDARWGSFAGKAMINTGFKVIENQYSPAGDAKALLVNTYTGEILGTVTSNEAEFGIGDLTDKVQILVDNLAKVNINTKV